MFDVEDEVARAVATVADEGTSGRSLGIHGDGRDVDTVALKPTQIEPTEIVVPDSADDAARMAELADLVDEDGRRARRERPDEAQGLEEAVAAFGRQDLDDDLPDGDDLLHFALAGSIRRPR